MVLCNMRRFRLLGALVLVAPFHAAVADTIHTAGDHPTIQAPIDAAAGSDEIIVASGSYDKAIGFFRDAVRPTSSRMEHESPMPTIAAAVLTRSASREKPQQRTRKARAPSATTTYQPTLSRTQARRIAAVIMKRNVKLWYELNAPAWTLRQLFSDDFPFPLPGPANMTLLDYTVESVRAWQNISTSAVITTRKAYIDRVYNRLKRDVPDMRIIPGLKLNQYYPYPVDHDFLADRAMWEEFAADALRCAKITGSRQIVIMAEGPMAGFYAGTYTPNAEKFKEAMAPLRESGLRIIWYPFGTHAGRPISDSARLLRNILEAVPDSWFPGVGDGYPFRERDPDQNARRKAHIKASTGRMVHHIFVGAGKGLFVWPYGKSRQAYTPVEFMRWLNERSFGEVWVYPGSFNSVTLGAELEALLIPQGFRIAADERTP